MNILIYSILRSLLQIQFIVFIKELISIIFGTKYLGTSTAEIKNNESLDGFDPIQDGPFRGYSQMGEAKKAPRP